VIAPKGKAHLGQLIRVVEDSGNGLPKPVVELACMLLDQSNRPVSWRPAKTYL